MSNEFHFSSRVFHLNQREGSRPYLSVHLRRSGAKTTARYFSEKTEDDPVSNPSAYVSVTTVSPDSEITTYMSLDQTEAMRDVLTAVLDEAAADDTRPPVAVSA